MDKIEQIPFEKFPYNQFKLLGMEKKDVLELPASVKNALRSGNRSSLIQFNNIKINGAAEAVTINAKLSLQKNGEAYELKMHPVNLSPKNHLELSEKEMDFLKKDPLNLLPKMVVGNDGKLVDSFVSLDQTTKEFVAVKRDKIKSPEQINDVYLSEAQKKDFANGKPIKIGNDDYQLDVNAENGVAGKNLQKIQFKHGKYNAKNLMLDAVLIATGLGAVVLMEHLAKMVFNNVKGNIDPVHELLKQDLKPAIKKTLVGISNQPDSMLGSMSNEQKNEMFVVNVKDHLQTNYEQNMKPENSINQNTIIKNDDPISEQNTNKIKEHLSSMVSQKTQAEGILEIDKSKIEHPEQRAFGETKKELKMDANSQANKAASATKEIKQDVTEIKQKTGLKR